MLTREIYYAYDKFSLGDKEIEYRIHCATWGTFTQYGKMLQTYKFNLRTHVLK